MSRYHIIIEPKAAKFMATLKMADKRRLEGAIYLLGDNPIPPKAKKLSNREGYRVRVGNFRIIYNFRSEVLEIHVIKIGQRQGVYKN
ncbi:MAG: type II toxin-antitoxin system RelE/ParE family toxin [Candidatus Planktophila sp.]|jgi:mRNA interferase RelE/StbE|nr:type II toxin-antitoxin system RelE/ParE family toxin [Candidatus Planktophila sp.]MBP7903160.1 type II toxin-antitoxin system RelE/ParE family toxin [Candidatus Planktophila sp.]